MIGSWATVSDNTPRVPAQGWLNGRPDWGWLARQNMLPAPWVLRTRWMIHDELRTGFPDAAYLAGIGEATATLGGEGWLFIVPPRAPKGDILPLKRMADVADAIAGAGFVGAMLDASGNDGFNSGPHVMATMLGDRGVRCLCEPAPLHGHTHWIGPGRGCVCQSYNLPRWHPFVRRYGLRRVMESGGTVAIEVVRKGRDIEFDAAYAVARCLQLREQFPGAVLFTPAGAMGPEQWAALAGMVGG